MVKKYKNLREFWGDDGVERVLELVRSKEKELKEKDRKEKELKEKELNENSNNTKGTKKI